MLNVCAVQLQRRAVAPLVGGDDGHVLDGARAAHRHLEAVGQDLPGAGRQERAQVVAGPVDPLGRHPAAGKEPFGETDGAQLEAAGPQRLAALAHHELGGAAADVHEHELAVVHGQGLQHPQVDEAGLLHSRDHLDLDAGLPSAALEELALVLGLPHGTGGHGPQLSVEHVGRLTEAGQRRHPPLHGVGAEVLHVARARSEANHLLLRGQYLEAAVRHHLGHDEMDRVGSDVDRGQDAGGLLGRSIHGGSRYPVAAAAPSAGTGMTRVWPIWRRRGSARRFSWASVSAARPKRWAIVTSVSPATTS